MVIMNVLEWPILSYYMYVIYYEKFRKVMQRTEKEALIITIYRNGPIPEPCGTDPFNCNQSDNSCPNIDNLWHVTMDNSGLSLYLEIHVT